MLRKKKALITLASLVGTATIFTNAIDRLDGYAEMVENAHTYQQEEELESIVEIAPTITKEITAYTAGYESTGKNPGDPAYGQTASGPYVEQGVTIAAGPDIPFGTKVYIPYFDGKPGFGDGVFTVQDRGGAISNDHMDVYFEDLSEAREFGRQQLEIIYLEGES